MDLKAEVGTDGMSCGPSGLVEVGKLLVWDDAGDEARERDRGMMGIGWVRIRGSCTAATGLRNFAKRALIS